MFSKYILCTMVPVISSIVGNLAIILEEGHLQNLPEPWIWALRLAKALAKAPTIPPCSSTTAGRESAWCSTCVQKK